jgi:hypothetical protein
MKKLYFLFILAIACGACSKKTLSPSSPEILFVGNSLTYANHMPDILSHIVGKFGESTTTASISKPNYALEDHWNDGEFQAMLKKGGIKHVIVQQGPSSQSYGKESLITYGEKYKIVCTEAGASLGFYMVWPSERYYYTFDGVITNYSNAAKHNQALLFPVGVAWKAYNENATGRESLYDSDGFHPSKAGSFLAALTIFHQLYPSKDLSQMKLADYSQWVKDQASFDRIIELVKGI